MFYVFKLRSFQGRRRPSCQGRGGLFAVFVEISVAKLWTRGGGRRPCGDGWIISRRRWCARLAAQLSQDGAFPQAMLPVRPMRVLHDMAERNAIE